ncbi:MAG: DUF1799 domain-containing protein [Proteobacteria bacterium]|nr:DUF1799 domain-containing protein [Pseudomonadota bacterium]
MEGSGFTAADYEIDPVDVWPDNWPLVRLFSRLGDQWRIGMNGRPSGMDYTLAMALMDRMKLDDDTFNLWLDSLQVMASAALDEMNKED